MRFLEAVRQYPVAVLAVVALAFVSWVWWDALPDAAERPPANGMTRTLPQPTVMAISAEAPPFVTALPKLKPGMLRAEVEQLVGAPSDTHPVTVTGDRATYHTAYDADFGAPHTVRPILPRRKPSGDRGAVVSLEFDATRPGHPLVNVHYSDPLF